MLSSSALDTIHVLSLYYRGFGKSTGNPTEVGSIIDSVSAIQWAVEMAHTLSLLALVAQNPGAALACMAANDFTCKDSEVGLLRLFFALPLPMLLLSFYSVIRSSTTSMH